MDQKEAFHATRVLHQPRPCRVCGQVFTPARWDALYCTPTCKSRAHRGGDLAYLSGLSEAAAKEHRQRQFDIAEQINTLQEYFRDVRSRRRERNLIKYADEMLRTVLSPETAALIKQIYETWRGQVSKAHNAMLTDGRVRTPEQIQAEIAELFPHIPPEAIAQILKEERK
jgi:hypothetical protein